MCQLRLATRSQYLRFDRLQISVVAKLNPLAGMGNFPQVPSLDEEPQAIN